MDFILPTVSSLLFWLCLYYILCVLLPGKSFEWNCRLVSLTHAMVSTSLCAVCAFITGPWPFDTPGEANTPLQTLCMIISLGYFCFDISWCFYMFTEGLDMFIHHSVSLVSLVYSLYIGYSGPEIIAVIFGSEITNPMLQLRWFLREAGLYHTRLALVNDFLFMSLFLGVRVGVGGLLAYSTLSSPKPTLFMKLGGVILYTVGLIWMVLILKFARKRFLGRKSASVSKNKLEVSEEIDDSIKKTS